MKITELTSELRLNGPITYLVALDATLRVQRLVCALPNT